MRVREDPESESWCKFLLRVGEGTETLINNQVALPESVFIADYEKELCEFVFKSDSFSAR